jgi:hypothetical protein
LSTLRTSCALAHLEAFHPQSRGGRERLAEQSERLLPIAGLAPLEQHPGVLELRARHRRPRAHALIVLQRLLEVHLRIVESTQHPCQRAQMKSG